MKAFGLVLLLVAATWAAPASDVEDFAPSAPVFFRDIGRIVGGTAASSGQFPYQVALYLTVSGGTSFCGGSIINTRWILTAAHCASGISGATVVAGSLTHASGGTRVAATGVAVHAEYNSRTIQNDIALLQLGSALATSGTIGTVSLSSSNVGSGVSVTAIGWGRTSDATNSISSVLNYVSLSTITNANCNDIYGNIQSGILCAKGQTTQSTCNGDSGGPLVTGSGSSAQQVGIVSFGSSDGCAKGYPVAFTRVSSYLSWISNYVSV